jgi:hypothetical protein
MFYLVLGVLLCLLVPWLPVWIYRRLPRPAAPLSEGQLRQLAAQLRHDQPGVWAEVVAVEEEPARADITRPQRPTPSVPAARPEEPENADPPSHVAEERIARRSPVPRLTFRSFHWLNSLLALLFIGGFLALSVGWAFLFHILSEEHARSFPSSLFLFKPRIYPIFALPSVLLGSYTTYALMAFLARLVMGRRLFLEYFFWDEGRVNRCGYNVYRFIRLRRILAFLVGVSSAGIVALAMSCYTRFTEDEIVVKPLFGLSEEKHAYGDIERLVISSHRRVRDKIVEDSELGIRFQDDQTWRTGVEFGLPKDNAERDRFLAFLQKKTGKPIIRLRLLEDMPGW